MCVCVCVCQAYLDVSVDDMFAVAVVEGPGQLDHVAAQHDTTNTVSYTILQVSCKPVCRSGTGL